TCLIEGTNISEGRGTHAPFRLIGAPWIDGDALAREMSDLELAGLTFAAATFTPAARKHAGERCGGISIDVIDATTVRPVAMGLLLIAAIRQFSLEQFNWKHEGA